MYEIKVSLAAESDTVHGYFFLDRPYVTGFTFDTLNGVPQPGTLDPFVGLVKDNGDLEILSREGSNEIVSVVIPAFNPQAVTQTGTVVMYTLNPGGVPVQGTCSLTAINWYAATRLEGTNKYCRST